MQQTKRTWFLKGMKDGIPICLGYFAVALTLGITARRAGFTAIQAALVSLTNHASAGEYIGFTLIAAGATYMELCIMEGVANARYLLMSCALSQKLSSTTSIFHRLLMGFFVTDEIFGVSIAVPGKLNPFYTYGVISVASPGWVAGTFLGVILGNVLPLRAVSALNVGIYGMFIAIFIPPAKKSKVIGALVAISFIGSYICSNIPFLAQISSGIRIILLTVVISLAAAILFPIQEEEPSSSQTSDPKPVPNTSRQNNSCVTQTNDEKE